MRLLILGSNSKLFCGWTTMTKGLSKGFQSNNVKSYILEGINRYNRNFNFNNPFYLSYHVRTNIVSLCFDCLRVFFVTLFYRPDHILIIPELLCVPTYIISKLLNVKYSIYSAGTYSSIILQNNCNFAKKAFDNAENIFPMSDFTKRKIKNKTSRKRIFTVFSGYNDQKYFLRNLKKDKYSIIFVGNLKSRKGFEILVKSLFKLPLNLRKKLQIRLIGNFDSKNFKKYEKLFFNKKINYKIYHDITDEHLSILFNKSSVNVLPSITEDIYYEGFGIVHSEAIASNCITIGSLNSGNESAIKKNNGFLISQGSNAVNELTDLLNKIFSTSSIIVPKGQKPLKWNDVTKKIIAKIN